MQIIEKNGTTALCDNQGAVEQVDLSLVDGAEVGSHVLVFLNRATDVLDEENAAQIRDAIEAVVRAREGESFDHLFADLIEREPELPDHLKPPVSQ